MAHGDGRRDHRERLVVVQLQPLRLAPIEMQPATTYDDNNIVMAGGGQPRREIGAGNPMSQFAAQFDGFSEAARAGRAHLTPGEMGLRDIRLIEAMYRSADAGGAVIEL